MIRAMSMYYSPPEPQIRPVGAPDPGTPTAARIAAILTVVLMLVVVGFNQLGGREPAPKPPTGQTDVQPPDPGEPFTLTAKFGVKMAHSLKLDPAMRREVLNSAKPYARTDEDRVRLAIVAADLLGPEEGGKQLDQLRGVQPPLDEDVHILREAYENSRTVEGADAQLLEDHHGWFGTLERTRLLPDTDPQRAALLAGAEKLVALVVAVLVVLALAIFGGIAALITVLVMWSSGRIRPAFVPPARGGSVFIETVAVFIVGYLLLHLAMGLISAHYSKNGEPPDWFLPVQLVAQWSLVVLPLWPLLRGVSWQELRQRIGWTGGRGIPREIGAGVLAYFAGLPLLAAVMGVTVVIVIVRALIYRMTHGQDLPPPSNPIADLIGKGSTLTLLILYALATLWAPLVEEAVFRGSLYRHLRSRLGVFAAALLSALTFGFMHGYNVLLLGPVICLGFVFALMREWRGSLIASMTAHCMHNATVMAIAILAVSALKD